MDSAFLNEHLLPGKLGHLFSILSLTGALLAAFSYFSAARREHNLSDHPGWIRLGRNGFIVHAASVFGLFIVLYYVITRHLFEYNYAWEHSNKALPAKYLLSCFWEGQEGSFMLWTFWHVVLGLIVMRTSGKLESRTMAVISLVQVFLATMVAGFYFGGEFRVGSNPFMLLREKMSMAPIFSQPNYLDFIQDGNGLNPLLQNYWMVIHPPVLFLGFASVLIPFAFLVAALWKGEYDSWMKPMLRWSLFSGGVLATGIMMGGAWAYESLTFGGYWAWDPVENASLVPWLVLVAALHTLIIYKSTGRALLTTVLLYGFAYLLVWYSTFLTRTGILGDTSVHAFTGEGKSLYWHLIVVLGLLIALLVGLLVKRWKSLPRIREEEATASREFWMFIGSFVLLLSAFQIIISTSIPVWSPLAEKILGKKIAPPIEPVRWYNSIQVWVAVIVSLLSAFILFLRFRKSDTQLFWKRMAVNAAIALPLAALICWSMQVDAWQYILLMACACFAVVANGYYAIRVQQGPLKKRGAALAHVGFGILIVGIILSSYRKEVISYNTLGTLFDFNKKTKAENVQESHENTILYKGVPVAMGPYFATYLGDSVVAPTTYFKIRYDRVDSLTHKITESFTLYPDVYINKKGGQDQISNNPSSKHYLGRDIFTYVNMFAKTPDTAGYTEHKVKQGDTIFLKNGYAVFSGFNKTAGDKRYVPQEGDLGVVGARLDVYSLRGRIGQLEPLFILRSGGVEAVEDTLAPLDLNVRFANLLPNEDAAMISTKQHNDKEDYVVLKAIVFPHINLVWLGTIVMVAGFFLSLYKRITDKKAKAM